MSNKPSPPFQTTPGGGLGGRVAGGTLNSDTSRRSEKPKSRRVALKVINHLGGTAQAHNSTYPSAVRPRRRFSDETHQKR